MINFEKKLKNKKIFVTGHTGFTGSWACFWLHNIGSEVFGYSLPPHTSPSLFEGLNLEKKIKSVYGDICNYKLLKKSIIAFQPDLILHLAAQPLVSKGYQEPLETFKTNIMGTANILEISKSIKTLKGTLCITTDKVYKNNENQNRFVETDILGGEDPYSASKSAAEIVIESFAKSYFSYNQNYPVINVARGGNIIGGGDWSENRLFPDYVKSVISNKQLDIRSSSSTRPWQHVLDLISGYFSILANILDKKINKYAAWNLGPHEIETYNVEYVLDIISEYWEKPKIKFVENNIKETKILTLNSNKAKKLLEWEPSWNTRKSIKMTSDWYKQFYNDPRHVNKLSLMQLEDWRSDNFKF